MARWKWVLVAIWWVLQGCALLLAAVVFFDWKAGPIAWVLRVPKLLADEPLVLAGYYGAFVTLQGLFLVPVRKPIPGTRGWSVRVSLAVAGFLIALLTVGVFLFIQDELWLLNGAEADIFPWIPAFVATLGVTWVVATALLIAFCKRGPRESLLARVSAGLFLGTMVEVAALIPLHVLVRRKSDCYCDRGTFWALVICASVGTLVIGPAIFLPLLAHRRRRWYEGRCEICGFDVTATPDAERCPSCGSGWSS